MAHVLDAFALIALALDEPAAAEVEALLRRGDCVMAAPNLAEAIDRLGRVHGRSEGELRAALVPILGEVLTVVATDELIAWRAAGLRRGHYRRSDSQLSLADCIALATVGPRDSLATADPPLAHAARAVGLDLLALPDTRGRRP